MKKLMALALGTALAFTTVSVIFAQAGETTVKKETTTKKKGKKKEGTTVKKETATKKDTSR